MRHLPSSTTTPLQTATALPTGHAVALKPWFNKKIVEQGVNLLHEDGIRFFSFQRRYGGLVTEEDICTTIQMAKGKGKRRFVFRDGECSQCVGWQGGTRCKHVAALALLCCASLLAGGTGIDLTGAQVVIHYDRWWNPAKEEQATARVHRMGQRHPVQVYKLVTVGTLEEKIHRLIVKKRQLAEDLIVEDDGSILKKLNRKELAGLFQYAG